MGALLPNGLLKKRKRAAPAPAPGAAQVLLRLSRTYSYGFYFIFFTLTNVCTCVRTVLIEYVLIRTYSTHILTHTRIRRTLPHPRGGDEDRVGTSLSLSTDRAEKEKRREEKWKLTLWKKGKVNEIKMMDDVVEDGRERE